ncbi:MAG TPA: hypothetical protein VGG24_06600, partial [Paraburkholderia sp.]
MTSKSRATIFNIRRMPRSATECERFNVAIRTGGVTSFVTGRGRKKTARRRLSDRRMHPARGNVREIPREADAGDQKARR